MQRAIITDYEKPGRLQGYTRQEKLLTLIEKIMAIMIASRKNSHDTFKSAGVLSQMIGKKPYLDQRIQALDDLFLGDTWKGLDVRACFALIQQTIDDHQRAGMLRKMVVYDNEQSRQFIADIQNENIDALDKLLQTWNQKPSVMDMMINSVSYLCQPTVSRKDRLFSKKQAISAANWWLEILITSLPGILAQLNKSSNVQRLDLTAVQQRVFVTSLADIIWEACQLPINNIRNQSPMYVGYDYYVRHALQTAQIKLEHGDTGICGLLAFVSPEGWVSYQNGGRTGDIYRPDKDKIRYATKLPEDDIILFRDILSTITTGTSSLTNTINLYSLSREVIFYIMLLSCPSLTSTSAKKQMMWNDTRMRELHSFFRQPTDKPMLKLHYIDPTPAMNAPGK